MAVQHGVRHIPALDGLRGVAIAGVLLFHGGHLTGGYLGVDLFFVLSGFLITTLLLSESSSTGTVRLGNFWARRARRLLPALAAVLIGVAAYCVLFAAPAELNQVRGDALATVGYVANWRDVFARQNYFALFQAPSPLQHTWSLAIEEQFYLVWPLVIVGLLAWWKRDAPKAVLVTSLALAALSSILMVVLYNRHNVSRVYYGTDTRAAAVLLGAALAAWLVVAGPVRSRAARVTLEILGFAGIAALAVAWTQLGGQAPGLYRGGFLVCGLASTAVIAAVVHPRRGPIAHALALRPLCLLGLISYGVYLWHWPIDVLVNESRSGLSGWTLFAVQTAITLTIAVLSYRFLEMPIRRGAFSARQWRIAIPAVAAFVVVLLVVSTAGGRSPDAFAAKSARAQLHFRSTHPGLTRVMLVGDSAAYTLAPGLAHAAGRGFDVVNGANEGCPLDWQTTLTRRTNNNPTWQPLPPAHGCDWPTEWPKLLARYNPNLVLISFGLWDIGDHRIGNQVYTYGTRKWRKHMGAVLRQAVEVLARDGARVGVLLNPASFTIPNQDALNYVYARTAYRLHLPALALAPIVNHGGTRYRYGVHYTEAGADATGKRIMKWVRHLSGLHR